MTLDKSKSQNSPYVIPTTNTLPSLRQTINTTSNWTVPNNVYGIWVHLAGGGGGGNAKSGAGSNVGSTGGTGGNGVFAYTPVTPGSTVAITIGAGGNGGVYSTNVVDGIIGNEGGTTYVNTSGASWAASGALRSAFPNTTNQINSMGFAGPLRGLTRQQIAFGPKSNSPRVYGLWATKEAIDFGGAHSSSNYSTDTNANAVGTASTNGGGSGGMSAGAAFTAGQFSGTGGASNRNANTGGSGVAFTSANVGAGGGGAGIAGNGSAASGVTGGAGGAGGGGGGAGGTFGANTGTAGAGGAGAVLIYY